jgi:hypothetical protein
MSLPKFIGLPADAAGNLRRRACTAPLDQVTPPDKLASEKIQDGPDAGDAPEIRMGQQP